MFQVKIKTGNAAFCDQETGRLAAGREIARILRRLADVVEDSNACDEGPIRDVNGHTVGTWKLTNR